ncbi:MAG: DUF1614 domain-containing protein [Oscillatoriales cyanobacterium SM2_3_0]|nr:DUF1614 domain-containing protein [Oscillatoriales cyanobacterium SM2_3_0]
MGTETWQIEHRSPRLQAAAICLLSFLGRSPRFQTAAICLLPFLRLIFWGLWIFLVFKLWSIVFGIVVIRLGIGPGFEAALFFIVALLGWLNLNVETINKSRRTSRRIGLNVARALIPILLAFYQFHRVQPAEILIVTLIVALISYPAVIVIPGIGIYSPFPRLWGIAFVAASIAMVLTPPGIDRPDVAVAFAGTVLGTTIGADLLHLKDYYRQGTQVSGIIGGAGLNDGIVLGSLYALTITEWWPGIWGWICTSFQ